MARRTGVRKSQDNNVPGMPGGDMFIPINGAGPGKRDPRSAGEDRPQQRPGANQAPIYYG